MFDTSAGQFKIFNKYSSIHMGGGDPDVEFAIYTTHGELVMASDSARITTSASTNNFGIQLTDSANVHAGDPYNPNGLFKPVVYAIASVDEAVDAQLISVDPVDQARRMQLALNLIKGKVLPTATYPLPFVDCESYNKASSTITGLTRAQEHSFRSGVNCMEKGDMVVFFDPYSNRQNPIQLNMYEIKKISRLKRDQFRSIVEINLDQGFTSFWHEISFTDPRAYIFRPPASDVGVYNYVSVCSGRGHCDEETGICDCFTGYSGVSCSDQSDLPA